jgi:glycosyltransferase involved in cell wall biosynthesis
MVRIDILGTRGFPSSYGGFETLVRHLAPYLVRRGHEVTVFARQVGGGPRTEKSRVTQGVRVVSSRGFDGTTTSTLSHGLSSTLRTARTRPDVALVMNIANGFFLPALKMRGVPAVLNVDGIEWEREKWTPRGRRVFYSAAKMTAKWAERLVSDSEAIRCRWQLEFGRDSSFIPYGGDPEVDPSRTYLDELGLSVEGFALIVARFVPENNVRLMLDAAVASHVPVVVVGSAVGSPIEAEIRSRHDPPRVHVVGHISDQSELSALWSGCGVYLHGHSVGGTNPALVQAMGLGAPVLALDTPFNREVLESSEQLMPREVNEITSRINTVMTSSETRARFRSNGESRVAAVYNWSAVCASYEAVLAEVAAQR